MTYDPEKDGRLSWIAAQLRHPARASENCDRDRWFGGVVLAFAEQQAAELLAAEGSEDLGRRVALICKKCGTKVGWVHDRCLPPLESGTRERLCAVLVAVTDDGENPALRAALLEVPSVRVLPASLEAYCKTHGPLGFALSRVLSKLQEARKQNKVQTLRLPE